jgi:flagellar biosynthesis protein FlhA
MIGGAVFERELLVAPRTRGLYLARAVTAATLLGIVATCWLVVTGSQAVVTIGDTARFGASLLRILAPVQLTLAVLVSALVAVLAVSLEKDRRTLELLLISRLGRAQLVLGKLAGSLLRVGLLLVANRLPREDELVRESLPPVVPEEVVPPSPQQMAVDARVEPLELNIAFDLIPLVDGATGGDLLDRVGALRRKIATELGFVMPSIRTRDAADLPSGTYTLKVHGVEVGRGIAPAGRVLVIGDGFDSLPGDDVREPVFGLAARWVPAEYQAQAEISGNTVVDRSTLIVTHLAEIVRRRAGRLLSRTDVKILMDGVRATDPQVVDDLTTLGVTAGEVQRVLGGLLEDSVPIKDLVRILEAIGDRARSNRSIEAMIEAARQELGPAITSALAVDNRLTAITMSASTEHRLLSGLRISEGTSQFELAPDDTDRLIRSLTEWVGATAVQGTSPVLVCSAPLRAALGRLVKATVPGLAVISYAEIGDHLQIDLIANVDITGDHHDMTGHLSGEPQERFDAFAAN